MSRRFARLTPLIVPAVAIVTGIVLARASNAQSGHPMSGATPAVAARSAPIKPSAGEGTNPYDDAEGEERHAASGGASRGQGATPASGAGAGAGAEGDTSSTSPASSASRAMVRINVPAKDGMLHIPAGKLSLAVGVVKNQPILRAIAVAPFWIDRTEVTVADYRACVAKGACSRPRRTSASCTYDLGDAQLPVSCVHWAEAESFCRIAGKRLPSEVEWEYAARGNIGTPFPWGGGTTCKIAVTLKNERTGASCASGHPDKVGAHPSGASVFGVLDLSGNVEEWTADWYVENLGGGPAPRVGASHVLRGGGWLTAPSMSKTTTRNWGSAVEAGPNVGFRCARDAE